MKTCPICGNENSDDIKYCAKCGAILIRERKEETDKRKLAVLIVGIVAVILIIGGSLFYLDRYSGNNSGSENTPVDISVEATDYIISYCPMEKAYGKLELVGIEDAWWVPDRLTITNKKGKIIENYQMERLSVESSDESVLEVEIDMDRELIIFVPKKTEKADITISYTQEDGKKNWDTQTITVFNSNLITNEYLADGEENIVIPPNGSVTWNGKLHYPPERPWEYLLVYEDRTIGVAYSNWNYTDIDDSTQEISVDLDDVLGKGEGTLCIAAFKENSSGYFYPVIVKKIFVSIR